MAFKAAADYIRTRGWTLRYVKIDCEGCEWLLGRAWRAAGVEGTSRPGRLAGRERSRWKAREESVQGTIREIARV